MWRALSDMVIRQTAQLNVQAEAFGGSAAIGSLQLSPDLAMPDYFACLFTQHGSARSWRVPQFVRRGDSVAEPTQFSDGRVSKC